MSVGGVIGGSHSRGTTSSSSASWFSLSPPQKSLFLSYICTIAFYDFFLLWGTVVAPALLQAYFLSVPFVLMTFLWRIFW